MPEDLFDDIYGNDVGGNARNQKRAQKPSSARLSPAARNKRQRAASASRTNTRQHPRAAASNQQEQERERVTSTYSQQGGAARQRRQKPDSSRFQTSSAPAAGARNPFSRKSKASKKNMSVEAMMQGKEAPVEGGYRPNIIRRAIFFLRTSSPREMWYAFMEWISHHLPVILLVAVVFLFFGMMISRYISVAGGFIFVIVGALLSRDDYDTASYCCYGAAFLDFILPYLL